MNTKIFLTAVLVGLLIGPLAFADQPKLLQKLQDRYDNLASLEVEYTQEVHSGVFSSVQKTSGKMYFAKQDKFRLQTDDQAIVSDGKTLWVYNKANEQVTIDKLDETLDLVRPSDYLFAFRESYSSVLLPDTTIDKKQCAVVRLVSDNKDEFIQQMTLYVTENDLLTVRAVYLDVNGNTVVVDFDKARIDEDLPSDTFIFKTPRGVEEVRLP